MIYVVNPAGHSMFREIGHNFFVLAEALLATREKGGLFRPIAHKTYELSAWQNRRPISFRVLVLSVHKTGKGKDAPVTVKMADVDTGEKYAFSLPQFSACAPKECMAS